MLSCFCLVSLTDFYDFVFFVELIATTLQHLEITNWISTTVHLTSLKHCTVPEVNQWKDVGALVCM